MRFKSLTARKNRVGYWFVLPWIIGFFLFFLIPFVQTVQYSFGTVTIMDGVKFTFEGIGNYVKALSSDSEFLPTLTAAGIKMTVETPIIVIFSLLAATLIQGKLRGRWLVRMIFFLPIIYATGLLMKIQQGDMMYYIVVDKIGGSDTDPNSISGLLIRSVNLGVQINYLADQIYLAFNFIGYYVRSLLLFIVNSAGSVFAMINRSGVQILIFLAALKAIPRNLYEAGQIEGATAFEMFWRVTLPIIVPHIITVAVFTIVDSFVNEFNPLMEMIRTRIFQNQEFSYGCTLAVIYFIFVSVAVAVIMGILVPVQRRNGA